MSANKPWLVAVWPGMGQVALSAGYYLMAKLGMHQLSEFSARDFFDVEQVEVDQGIISLSALPRSRLFIWKDPAKEHDLILFIGEAQPPRGRYAFCEKLIEKAKRLGVKRVFTFAAMATHMHPEHEARVFGAATDEKSLKELRDLDLETLQGGTIGGLNGVLLGVAAEAKLSGSCLLGEMPHLFAQLPFPKASLAVLKVFTSLSNIEIDFTELSEQAESMQQTLGEILAQIEQTHGGSKPPPEEASGSPAPEPEPGLPPEELHLIETLFEEADKDRSKAYELKSELDRLGLFKQYENRFLDLFLDPD